MINVQIGAPIPIFNKNQGTIAAARAVLTRACKDAVVDESGDDRLGGLIFSQQ